MIRRSRIPVRNGPFLLLAIVVCPLAAGFLGWAGGFTATLYQLYWGTAATVNLRAAGMLLGLGAGLVASLAWCAVMIVVAVRRLLRTGQASPRLVAWGAFAGHAAALLATGILLGGMMILNGAWNLSAALLGLVFSAVAGLGLGAIGGLLAWGAAAWAAEAQSNRLRQGGGET
jgi:hypothetical protein